MAGPARALDVIREPILLKVASGFMTESNLRVYKVLGAYGLAEGL